MDVTTTSDRVCTSGCNVCNSSSQYQTSGCQTVAPGNVTVVLDSGTATPAVMATGNWATVNIVQPSTMLGSSFLSDGDSNKGNCSVLFLLTVPFGGWYRVSVTYDAKFDRAVRVPVTVTDMNGARVLYVNERVGTSPSTVLGIFRFNGTGGSVLIENRGTDQNTTDTIGTLGLWFLGLLFA